MATGWDANEPLLAEPETPAGHVLKSDHELKLMPPVERPDVPLPQVRQRLRPRRREQLDSAAHERHVKAIAFWQGTTGVLLALGTLLGAGGLLVMGAPFWAALIVVAVGGIFTLLHGAVGYGLWNLRPWARWTAVALSVLGLLQALPGLFAGGSGLLGTALSLAWSGAVLWALLCPAAPGVFSRKPKKVAWWSSAFFWVPLTLVGLVVVGGVTVLTLTLLS